MLSHHIIAVTGILAGSACVSSSLTSEDNLADRCSDAASVLRSCLGTTPTDFEASCLADPSVETLALVDELVASSCTDDTDFDDDRADSQLAEVSFVTVCAPAVGAALLLTRFRNNGVDGLNAADTQLLRDEFGDLVDDVSIYWNAELIDDWNLGIANIQFKFDVYAQTLGTRIFIDDTYKPGDAKQLEFLAHELVHAQQSESAGGFYPGFAFAYCSAFYQSNFDYHGNELEIEAEAVASEFARTHL